MTNAAFAAKNLLKFIPPERAVHRDKCPHCGSSHVIHYGKFNGKQRFLCKFCRRTFNVFTGTPLNGTHHLEKWPDYLECMLKSMSLRDSGKKINICYVTLFYWRHKVLGLLKEIKPKKLEGILELDDIYIKYSEKGNKNRSIRYIESQKSRDHNEASWRLRIYKNMACVIAVMDSSNNVYSKNACFDRPCTDDIEKAVGMLIGKGNKLCTNNKPEYRLFMMRRKLKLCGGSINGIKNAWMYLNNLVRWMERFLGVATKYLDNYLGWYKFLHDADFDEGTESMKKLLRVICA